MKSADQVIILNIVVGFEQWIEVNALRRDQDPERSISSFVKGMLKLNARDSLAARKCYTYAFDRWQRYLDYSPLFKCVTVESRQVKFIQQVDRARLGLVELSAFQLAWLKIRYAFLLARVS